MIFSVKICLVHMVHKRHIGYSMNNTLTTVTNTTRDEALKKIFLFLTEEKALPSSF